MAVQKKKNEAVSEFWTSTEFRAVINVSNSTLKKLLKEGQVAGAYRIGNIWRIHKETFYKDVKEDKNNEQ